MDIETDRLILRLVPLSGLAATAAKDLDACHRIINLKITEAWLEESWVAELRLRQWTDNPAYGPWSMRAIALKATDEVIGNINCHHLPMPFQLGGKISLAVEIGYTIFVSWRRRGYAIEAIRGYLAWADSQGVQGIVLSIAPGNIASLGLASAIGAEHIGSQVDEINGPEDIYFAATAGQAT